MSNTNNKQRTLSIIKPDAVEKNYSGAINALIESNHLKIIAQKMIKITPEMASTFYAVHKERPFFNDLVKFMCNGPVVVQVLEGENAVAEYRKLMGATNPAQAEEGTIRKLFAENIEKNAVHGSDSLENAAFEISYFFAGCDLS